MSESDAVDGSSSRHLGAKAQRMTEYERDDPRREYGVLLQKV